MSENTQKCNVCGKPSLQKCSSCLLAFYCSREHQKIDWKNHKQNCINFRICENEHMGRYLVATKAFKEGEIVLDEAPLVWGPPQITPPVCLGCGRPIHAEDSIPCSKCGWPMCSEECQNSSAHLPECHYTELKGEKVSITSFDTPHPSYQSITALRCMYQKEKHPRIWEKIIKLESHTGEREKSGKDDLDRFYVVKFIRKFLKLENTFGEKEILKVCGILMVNGQEVPLAMPPYVALYYNASFLEHSCRANCYKTFTPNGHVLIIAGTPIQKGDRLSICYTDPLWGTTNRRHHLKQTKFFDCVCDRCKDPTEFGSYFSAVRCLADEGKCGGELLPETFLEDVKQWSCRKCKNTVRESTITKNLERIGKDLEAMEKGKIEPCKKFLEHYRRHLPDNNFYLTDVKLALLHLIGQNHENGLADVDIEDLELKMKLTKQLLDLVAMIAPAEKRLRGQLLFEYHACVAELGRRRGTSGFVDPADLYATLIDSRKILLESIECLKHEPEAIHDGLICAQARFNLEKLEEILRNMGEAFAHSQEP